jgi:hypothetical protein
MMAMELVKWNLGEMSWNSVQYEAIPQFPPPLKLVAILVGQPVFFFSEHPEDEATNSSRSGNLRLRGWKTFLSARVTAESAEVSFLLVTSVEK